MILFRAFINNWRYSCKYEICRI